MKTWSPPAHGKARFPERDRPRVPRQQLLDHPDRRLGADRPGGPAGHPREEDPQIVVPLADVMVSIPGYSADQVEQLVATPLERILYQIDGVEYVYSMSRENQAIITVRFYVGQDRERSLVKLFKRINETSGHRPAGCDRLGRQAGGDRRRARSSHWRSPATTDDSHTLRRVGEEVVQRLSALAECLSCLRRRRRTADRSCGSRSGEAPGLRASARSRCSRQSREPTSFCPPAASPATMRSSGSRQGGARSPGTTGGAGRRGLSGPSGFPQGRRHRARRPGGGGELRSPRLGTGTRTSRRNRVRPAP